MSWVDIKDDDERQDVMQHGVDTAWRDTAQLGDKGGVAYVLCGRAT